MLALDVSDHGMLGGQLLPAEPAVQAAERELPLLPPASALLGRQLRRRGCR